MLLQARAERHLPKGRSRGRDHLDGRDGRAVGHRHSHLSPGLVDGVARRVALLFPNLAEWLSRGPHDPDGYFDVKLGLIMDGLRARLS
jgi:hypothetical protein